ncbi:MAG: aldose 1-epimerase family protein [Ferruginibacter sp.]|nr:aldose 1-epimerase family protein [Cytophagales bacterium]
MTHTLENEQLRAQVNPRGAELVSLQARQTGLEYLWQADPAVWGRHAPVLFPIVGKLRNNQYAWNGESFSLPQHGFARDGDFEVLDQTPDRLVLRLQADAASRRVYPFEFELRITHALYGNRLDVGYEVINPGDGDLYFSIGAHPGFICPLGEDEVFEDYFLEFDQPETLDRHLIEGGLFNGKTEPLLRDSRIIPLQRSLFEQDAIVVKGFRSSSLTLKSRKSTPSVKVALAGFPYLGIWTKEAPARFVCIEPWYGLADRTDASGQLSDKEGIRMVPTGGRFHCQHTVEVTP